MRAARSWWLRARAVLHRPSVEREMEAELAGHLEAEVEQLMAQGMPELVARQRARATMGHLDQIKEECRDARGTMAWEQLRLDVTFGARLLARNRTFTIVAVATMALGIGSATAGFGLIDGVLLRPLPFREPERLFAAGGLGMRGPFDVLRTNSRQADYAAHLGVRTFLTPGREGPERQEGSEVSANFFRVLGVSPRLGRTFSDGEDRPGRHRVAVLSEQFWRERLGGRADAVGRRLMLDEVSYEIVGVMPAGFAFPAEGVRVWVPIQLDPRNVGPYWGSGGVTVFGRLNAGAGLTAAAAEIRTWMPRIRGMFPWRMPDAWGQEISVEELRASLVSGARVQSLLLFGVVGLVLLIAVLNVTNLMLGQAAARRAEWRMRAALGATPGRLTRQIFTEALLLALAGGTLGALLANAQLAVLRQLLPPETPRLAEVAVDARVLAFSMVISLVAAAIFGWIPAWQLRRSADSSAAPASLQVNPRGWRRGWRADSLLVMTEAAFATILLVGAGLLLRSLWALLQVNPGFVTEGVITAEVSPNAAIVASTGKTAALGGQLRESLMSYPGVRQVAAMNVLPLTPDISAFTAAIEDHPRLPGEPQFPLWSTMITPEHGEALSIPLRQGRRFTPADQAGSEPVVLISETTARRFWPDRSPIGRRLRPVWQSEWRTIVGVVGDIKNYAMTGPPDWVEGEVYLPMAQAIAPPPSLKLVARISGDEAGFRKRLPELVRAVCAQCAVTAVAPMRELTTRATQTSRSLAWLVGAFAILALGMAAIGIYGVVNAAVARRTRELGVRIALGAGSADVAWLVLGSSLGYTLAGVAAGLATAWVLAQSIGSLLYGIGAHDGLSFGMPATLLLLIAAVAGAGPLGRALRIDPARALREG